MTVSTSTNRVQYNTNGTTGPWTVPFYFLDDSHLAVIYTTSAGLETLLTLTTHYSVTGAGDEDGGTVTTVSSYAAGGTITILRSVPATQDTEYVETDSFPAVSHMMALDKLTMLVQQALEVIGRALVFSPSDATGSTLPAAAARASKLIGFNSSGVLSMNTPVEGTASALALLLASTANAAEGTGMSGWGADLAYAAYTCGNKLQDVVSPSDYGADNTGGSDPSAAFTSAIARLTSRGGGVLLIRPGTYAFTTGSTFTIPSRTRVVGYGATLDFSGSGTIATSRIRATGSVGSGITLTANVAAGDSVLPLSSVTGLAAGDVLRLSSDALVRLDAIGGSTTQTIGEMLVISSISGLNVTICGYLEGAYLTADNAVAAKITPSQNVSFEGLRIIGTGISGADTSTLEIGINGLYCRDFTVRDCRVDHCDYNGIRVEQAYGFDISNCVVNHEERASAAHTAVIQYGISILGTATRGRIAGNRVTAGKHGVVFSENTNPGIGRDVTIESNTIVGTWAAGIATHESNDRVTISRNRLIGCARGLDIRIRNVIISGNEIRGIPGSSTIGDGVFLQENAGDVLIEGNRIDGCRYGVRGYNSGFPSLARPVDIVIRNNTFENIDQIGVYLQQTQHALTMTGIVIAGNSIRAFGQDGIRLDGEFTNATIQSNKVICDSAPAGYGVRLMGTNKTEVDLNSFIGMTPVRLEDDTQSVPVAPRNPILVNNKWDHSGSFLSQSTGSQVVRHGNVETGDSSITIAAGVITVPTGVRSITVDTQSAAASDDLDTINGGDTTDLVVFRAASEARTVVFKDGTGNLTLNGDFSATSIDDSILLRHNGAGWSEVSRSDNTA